MTASYRNLLAVEAIILMLPALIVTIQGITTFTAFLIIVFRMDSVHSFDVFEIINGVAPVISGVVALWGLLRMVSSTIKGVAFEFGWTFFGYLICGTYPSWYLFDVFGFGALVFTIPLAVLLCHLSAIQWKMRRWPAD